MLRMTLAFSVVAFSGQAALAQYAINAPLQNKNNSSYKQQLYFSSNSESNSSGQTEYFKSVVETNISPVETSDMPKVVSDNFSRKGSSTQISFKINNIIPVNLAEASDTSNGPTSNLIDPETGIDLLALKKQDLSTGSISINVTPDKTKVPTTTTSANFSSTTTATFRIYAETNSPEFVNNFKNAIFNKFQ